jgi:hypothetical protein
MDASSVPPELHWMIPIVEKLNADGAGERLNQKFQELVSDSLTNDVRALLEEWIDSGTSTERSQFNSAMAFLDEMGLLEATEPTLDYEFWLESLTSANWGKRRNAVIQIGKFYLAGMSEQQRESLAAHIESLQINETHPNTIVWLAWMKCLLHPGLKGDAAVIRAYASSSLDGLDNSEVDLPIDAWSALLSIPQVESTDVANAEQFIFSSSTDEFDAAVVLGALLQSETVSLADKFRVRDEALIAASDEVRRTADEFEV